MYLSICSLFIEDVYIVYIFIDYSEYHLHQAGCFFLKLVKRIGSFFLLEERESVIIYNYLNFYSFH